MIWYALPCYVMLSKCYVMISHVMLCYSMLCYVIQCHARLSDATLSYPNIIHCCATSSHVLLCYKNVMIYNLHGVSIKTKPNCLCHIYRMPDRIILKLSRYL